jgi:hypothetical protein
MKKPAVPRNDMANSIEPAKRNTKSAPIQGSIVRYIPVSRARSEPRAIIIASFIAEAPISTKPKDTENNEKMIVTRRPVSSRMSTRVCNNIIKVVAERDFDGMLKFNLLFLCYEHI